MISLIVMIFVYVTKKNVRFISFLFFFVIDHLSDVLMLLLPSEQYACI